MGQPRLGGAVTLRRLNGGGAHPGRGTAWDVERVAEYTLEGLHGRIRCHLEPGTVLRFTNEFDGDGARTPLSQGASERQIRSGRIRAAWSRSTSPTPES